MSLRIMASATLRLDQVVSQWQGIGPDMRERLIVFAAIGVATAWVVVWVVFFRKRHRRQHRHHHRHHSSPAPALEAADESSDDTSPEHHKRAKWRRRRRDHRPRNPTLAETGGLPPARTGEPPEILP